MSALHGWKSASLTLCIAAATTAAPLLAQNERPAAKGDGGPAVIEVKPAKFKGIMRQHGWLERSKVVEVICAVEGQSTIQSLAPHGTTVKAGDVVCELDRSALKAGLRDQEMTTREANGAYQDAKLRRLIAEIALTEYTEGIAKQEELNAEGEIQAARASLERSQENLERIRRAQKQVRAIVDAKGGAKSPADILSELNLEERLALGESLVEVDKLKLEQNQSKQNVFKNFTRGKKIKELESNIEKAKADELAKEQLLELEQLKEKKFRSQLAKCTIRAPMDGIVKLRLPGIGTGVRPPVAGGKNARERETLLTVSSGPLVARVVLPEVLKGRIAVGNSARIMPVAFLGASNVLNGVVERIDTTPEVPARTHVGDDQTCAVTIKISKQRPWLGPGLPALVEIAANESDSALVVPLEAVRETTGAARVAVVNPDGGSDWRSVSLGARTDTAVEIVQGIKSGESVLAGSFAGLGGE